MGEVEGFRLCGWGDVKVGMKRVSGWGEGGLWGCCEEGVVVWGWGRRWGE